MTTPACCPCGQLSGCVCTDGPACSTICERKTGSAELCGFPEFLPSDPPKFYKRRTTSGLFTTLVYGDAACGGTVVVPSSAQCREKNGLATMCGVTEWANISNPVKYYRRNSGSGSMTHFTGTGCPVVSENQTWAGAVQFNKDTGAVQSDDRCYQVNGGPCQSNPTGFNNYAPSDGGWSAPANDPNAGCGGPPSTSYRTADKAISTTVGRNICNVCGVGGSHKKSGSNQGQLTDQDTETDAIRRVTLGIPNWSAPGSCSALVSYQDTRGPTGTNLFFRVTQTRLVVTSGLTIGVTYEGRIAVEKRLHKTSDPWVDSGNDIIFTFTAAAASYTSDWKDIPNEQTWEYRAAGSTVRFGMLDTIADTWNLDENYAPNLPAVCAPTVVTDTSNRTIDGAPVAWPFDGTTPNNAYGGLAISTIAAAERHTVGTNVCTDTVGDWSKGNGDVLESLSNEDTEQNAIDRATAAAAWLPCLSGCTVGCTSFETLRGTGAVFGFGIVRTKAQWAATIGTNYQVTIRFASRVLGTGGPFLFYGLMDVVVTADVVSESTDWIDCPREAGLEIIVANCTVIALP